ncbi:MAG: hypothetical protein PHU07_05340 [Acidocella sp.]|nr:hypothetical protein [Acidocella sp.]
MMKAPAMRSALFFVACVAVLTLTGCVGAFDPFQRPGDWSATGAANKALAQQAANKSDLISGQSESGSNGIAAVAGIEKAMTGGTATGLQTTTTPTASTTSISVGN